MIYDIGIIGAGPAGLTAAIFARRYGLNVIVFDNPEQPSNLAIAHIIENYPGVKPLSGMKLLEIMRDQTTALGIEIKNEKVTQLSKSKAFVIQTDNGKYESKSVIIAMGLSHRKADISGAEKFSGRGVFYCAVCDGPLFRGKDVAVVGGGDSAAKTCITLRDMGANNVYIVHRRDEFRAEKALQEEMRQMKINFVMESVVNEVYGSKFVEGMKVKNVKTGKITDIKVSGVFVEIGSVPVSELVKPLGVGIDANGFVVTNEKKETNVPGIFAAGDVTNGQLKQDITAASDGAVAAISAYKFLRG